MLELDRALARADRTALEELRAEQNHASRGRSGAPTPEEREQLAALAARGRELSDEETAVRGERDAALASLPNLPAPTTPPTRTRCCGGRRGGRHRPRPPGARRPADRHGARRAAVRLALRLPARRARAARARARPLRAREAARRGLRAGDPAGAGARAGAVRDRHAARHRAADLPPARRRPVPGRAPPRSRSRRCTATRSSPPTSCRCATPASPPASAARPAPPARTRAGSSACTSSTRSRCSAFVEPDEAARRARAAAGDRGVDPERAGDPLPGGRDRGRRPRRLGGEEVRLRGVAARARAATAS